MSNSLIKVRVRPPQRTPLSRSFPTPLRSVHATEEAAGMWGLAERVQEGAGRGLPVTFLVHCLTVLVSSEITMSTHLRHGSRVFFTCFFTMVSNAMSGVNSPVLNTRSRRRAVSQAATCQECQATGHGPSPAHGYAWGKSPPTTLSEPRCSHLVNGLRGSTERFSCQ